jgi:UDP-N-acetylmuramoylalanine--D-glutamate ligase
MLLIYWKWKVGKGIAWLCDFLDISYEIKDDSDTLDFQKYETIIPSPGIPSHHSVYRTWKVKSELDFAYEFLPKDFHIIAVTGTDGKSTTSWILYELLRREFGDERVYLSGNFDVPFSETVHQILEKKQKNGYIVLEVSSFMAYQLNTFRTDYAIFTNFKRDHLNWHKDLKEYFDAKMNLLHTTKKGAILNNQVLTFASENGLDYILPSNTKVYSTSDWNNKSEFKNRTNGDDIIISWRKKYSLKDTNFSGIHNALNILSATLVTNQIRICSKRTKEYLKQITWLPHRLEKIGEKNGVLFIEDSKSTSAQSLEAALSSFGGTLDKNLLLIVWGSDKGDTFHQLAPKFKNRAKAMVCIGATKSAFITIAENEKIPYLSTDSLQEGVLWLYAQARTWDILMLSPGCASFWLFRDYLDRAVQFREAIKKLP